MNLPTGFQVVKGYAAGWTFAELEAALEWSQEHVKLFGKSVPTPRLTSWYGSRAYTYSGVRHEPRPFPKLVAIILATLNDKIDDEEKRFNSVLVNLYRDGSDSVAWHADDEPELGLYPVIASLSFGATRRFGMRLKGSPHRETYWTGLEHGDLLVMSGHSQVDYLHSIPKTSSAIGPRINLTFRTTY